MQRKINFIIWTLICIFIIFFLGLSIYNPFQLREYSFSNSKNGNIEVKFYSKNKNIASNTLSRLKKIKYDQIDSLYIKELLNVFKLENIDTFLIHVNENIAVGNYYKKNEPYKIALFTSSNTLYKVIDAKNKVILAYHRIDYDEYDKIFVMENTIEKAEEVLNSIKEKSILEIKQEKLDGTIYILKNTKEVYFKE